MAYSEEEAELIRDNERMKAMLRAIAEYARRQWVGAWRWQVAAMAAQGLGGHIPNDPGRE